MEFAEKGAIPGGVIVDVRQIVVRYTEALAMTMIRQYSGSSIMAQLGVIRLNEEVGSR